MEYFMVPAQKVPSLQHFRKTEKEVIGGLCRCVYMCFSQHAARIVIICADKAHLATALRQRARSHLLLCTRLTHGGAAGIYCHQTLK